MNSGKDTSPELWLAIWRLAEVWSQIPMVREIAATLPRNRPLDERGNKAVGISALVRHLELRAGMVMKPLKYASHIPALLDQPLVAGFGMPVVDRDELDKWLQMAAKLEGAHRITLGWLRSSLAGYPLLRAPQLAPSTPLTTREMTPRYIWFKEDFASGLNQRGAPPSVPDLLGVDARGASQLDQAARDVSMALTKSQVWSDFNSAMSDLDDDAKEALRAARHELKGRLSAEALDSHEPNRALPRAEYRSYAMNEVVESLSGPARVYADAFGEVDRLLDLTMGDIFGELVLFGEPWQVAVFNIEAPSPGEPIIGFETESFGPFLTIGQVLWLTSEVVADAVRIESQAMKMDQVEGTKFHFEARVLLKTGEAWPAPASQILSKDDPQ
ncbi:hypothetical protein GCM10009715_21500 [Paeniglutamicibacter psychrophenolicus]|uniref:Uncharacterized protein n=1 Tax=Paeniglutamicibacter psychrophenolicus TaxID=257454 RepID=A0ABS4WHA2_9MICC|nr:hypothetical protein [Paeniglutamicibacter psychrophenolicus]MBP2375586.1 hypothetical protein [Paeniglutamicibacter psychrophenolicus]